LAAHLVIPALFRFEENPRQKKRINAKEYLKGKEKRIESFGRLPL
jgi:hypothetical protein